MFSYRRLLECVVSADSMAESDTYQSRDAIRYDSDNESD